MISSLDENIYSISPKNPDRTIYTVSHLTREIKLVLQQGFTNLWVEGEISNFKRHDSGHIYFSLKDREAQISCVMWRGRNQNLLFQPQDGMKVLVLADLTVYEKYGRYQLDVVQIRPAGIGELQFAFQQLKTRLEEEGLFSAEHKKQIPKYPRMIGVVTSPTGAAIRDIQNVIRRRFPSVQLILRPVRVQGEGAAEEIAQAIHDFNDYGNVDLLIVGRGGGSIEDLWAFNEEVVARAIFDSKIPIISAVGHEIDFSIADFVADLRAPTPSAAAELAVPDKKELLFTLDTVKKRMVQSYQRAISSLQERISSIERSYGLHLPFDMVREYRLRVDDITRNLKDRYNFFIDTFRTKVFSSADKLETLNPENVLQRGYSITSRLDDDQIIKSSEELNEEDAVRIRFAHGAALGTIYKIEEN